VRTNSSAFADLVLQAPIIAGRPYRDVGAPLRALRAAGWSQERLDKNDLRDGEAADARYDRFWATMARLQNVLGGPSGVDPIFIKSVREYPYSDGNVDVVIPKGALREVEDRLAREQWVRPTFASRVEQRAMERGKLKMQSSDPSLLAAHLYEGVSWRYQPDIGLLRAGTRSEVLRTVAVRTYAPRAAQRNVEIWIPADHTELVLQTAHIVFENYRMSLGEAMNLVLLRQRAQHAWPAAEELARQFGCDATLRAGMEHADWMVRHALELVPSRLPMPIPFARLAPAIAERSRWFAGRGDVWNSVLELSTFAAFFPLLRSVRAFRRWRRGHEDFR
jgi:hypothetical protein